MLGLSKDQNRVSINLVAKASKGHDCELCYFGKGDRCINNRCSASERVDKRNIIWVVDNKPAKIHRDKEKNAPNKKRKTKESNQRKKKE